MPTPAIQTLINDAQQVLNLDSISAVRSVVAVSLANANTGTPLNPNLTTQQLWNEFYQVVTRSKSDIESIIANQLMKFLYSPPAPGGVGADKQVIFNDGGVLAGDPQFLWNKTTNLLTVTGAATITGDLTVDTSTLKVDSANNRVGVLTASPAQALDVASGNLQVRTGGTVISDTFTNYGAALQINAAGSLPLRLQIGGSNAYEITSANVHTWQNVGGVAGTAMTLNSTGLGVGGSPVSGILLTVGSTSSVSATANALQVLSNKATFVVTADGATNAAGTTINYSWANGGQGPLIFRNASISNVMTLDSSGNVGIGVTPSAWGGGYTALQFGKGAALWSPTPNTGGLFQSLNSYFDGTNRKFLTNDFATEYRQLSGTHSWLTSPSGTAGNAITFTQAMTLDASGNLLVGKTANYGTGETQTLQLKSSVIFGSDNTGSASNRNWSIGTNASAAGSMEWTISSTNTGWPNFAYRMQITSAGDVNNTTGTYGTISDIRLKENISDARNYLADLLKLRVVKYSLKEEASAVATKLGFIAQEVEQVFPNLVDQSDKEYEGAEGIRSVKTSILIPMLLKAIQELAARVQTLETR